MQTGLGVADKIIGSGVHACAVGSVATGDTFEAVVPLDWLDPAADEVNKMLPFKLKDSLYLPFLLY